TLCKNYTAEGTQSFEQYIRQQGSSQDPILAFHQAHGAEIVKAIAGYRPQDRANLGNGVLVAYDILNRTPRQQRKTEANAAAVIDSTITMIDQQQISQFVQGEVAQLLGVGRSECDIDRPLMEMGLDSADLLKLQQEVERKFELKLGAGFFFEHNTLTKVSDYLTPKLVTGSKTNSSNPVRSIKALQSSEKDQQLTSVGTSNSEHAATDIAIIGMSCKLPGGIETPEQLWQVLASERCMISPFPQARGNWPTSTDQPGIKLGGFI